MFAIVFKNIVTATDAVTGQVLTGTVRIQSPVPSPSSPLAPTGRVGKLGLYKQPSGPTGQPLTYPSCGQIESLETLNLTPGSAPAPCVGSVRVPYYPDASYQDVPDVPVRVDIQKPGGNTILPGIPPK